MHHDPAQPADPELARAMTRVMTHRGPDSEGYHVQDGVALGMRRLAIIDLATGDQPITNEDGSIVLVMNGEIYNFRELRAELAGRGHVFSTQADTEVIVHLYEEHGDDCVQHLRGMFAFALWDTRRRRLLLARDRMGQKPLYYANHGGSLCFGSEIKCLRQWPGLPADIDMEAIHHYLTLQYIPDPLSAYKAIRKLPPAHRLVCENGQLRCERYWDIAYGPKHTTPDAELAAELRDRFTEAVKLRLISDVPLGAHLSGGIDSSLVVAAMARTSDAPVKTFSIGFEEESFSELSHARTVAERYGTEHHEFTVSYGDIPDMMAAIVRACDEPFADSSALPMYYLSELTRQHVTVAMNGDGGDELFAGYQRYLLDRYANLYARLPGWITGRAVPAVADRLPEPVNIPIERNVVAGLRRLQQVAETPACASLVRWGSYFSEPMKTALWKPEFLAGLQQSDSAQWLCEAFNRAEADSFLDRTLYTDSTNYLPGDLLVKADRMTMAHSLEGRSPFLDHELVNWAARLPCRLKLKGRSQKHILKTAFAEWLPASILHRPKQGFGIPVGAWFRGPLGGWISGLLSDPAGPLQGWFRAEALQRILDEHARGKQDHGKRLWTLAVLSEWLSRERAA